MSGPGGTHDHVGIGPVAVRTDAADVAAFISALELEQRFGPVPLIFPIRWLSLPAIHAAVTRELGLAGAIVVQQSQTFTYHREFAIDRDYDFTVEGRRERTPTDRTVLHATARDSTGEIVATLDALLRTIEPGGSRDAPARHWPVPDSDFPTVETAPIELTQTRRYAAASLDDNPIHSDLAVARAAGLEGLVIHGMQAMGRIEAVLRNWLPALRIDRFHGNFLRPIPVGSRLRFSGRIAKRVRVDGDTENLIVRVIAATDSGHAACVGEISGRHHG